MPLLEDDAGVFNLRVPACVRGRWVGSVVYTAGIDRRGEVTFELVRTIACASNKSDPCPYRHVRRGRDP